MVLITAAMEVVCASFAAGRQIDARSRNDRQTARERGPVSARKMSAPLLRHSMLVLSPDCSTAPLQTIR